MCRNANRELKPCPKRREARALVKLLAIDTSAQELRAERVHQAQQAQQPTRKMPHLEQAPTHTSFGKARAFCPLLGASLIHVEPESSSTAAPFTPGENTQAIHTAKIIRFSSPMSKLKALIFRVLNPYRSSPSSPSMNSIYPPQVSNLLPIFTICHHCTTTVPLPTVIKFS